MTAAGLGLAAGVYDFCAGHTAGAQTTAADGLPDIMTFTATIRDFKAAAEQGGHADFEVFANSDAVMGLVNDTLDSEGKPVFKDSYGKSGCAGFKNAAGQRIMPSLYNQSLGDVKGTLGTNTAKQITSAASFGQWYRNTAGVNTSKTIPIKLQRVAGTKNYVFDSATAEPYKSIGGFFPINGDLFGNYSTTGKNFHFTTEVTAKFVYSKADNAVFNFTGDDDLWVFIDGKLVMDLGGLHTKQAQSLEVNRLNWLVDGKEYTLKIFHAERHTTQSNFRIETSLQLLPAPLPPASGLYD
jgi:fibro-slime domain-containing protein